MKNGFEEKLNGIAEKIMNKFIIIFSYILSLIGIICFICTFIIGNFFGMILGGLMFFLGLIIVKTIFQEEKIFEDIKNKKTL